MNNLHVGNWIEVRSKEEILATLDEHGRKEGLPFMPQMFEYCGKKFQIYKSAHKTCDFVYTMKSRSLPNGIHLKLRCDGAAYGGCQHACLLYWKAAWLKWIDETSPPAENPNLSEKAICTDKDVYDGTRRLNEQNETIYTCQGTEIPDFTKPLAWWDFRQYLEDYTSGNASMGRLCKGFFYGLFYFIGNLGIGLGHPLRWFLIYLNSCGALTLEGRVRYH